MFDETVIDAHVHVGHVRQDDSPMTAERLLSWMDDHGIDRAVLLPLESPEASSYYITTNTTLELAATHPDRFVPFCGLDPRMNIQTGRPGFADRITEYLDRGARGFGELKAGLPIDHDRMRMLYELCDDHDLPVLVHMDHKCGTDEIGLPGFERVLNEFPAVDFIAHAQGWWAHISADVPGMDGYPEGPVEPGGRCDQLLDEYDNCYADISARSGWNALTRDPAFGQRFLERHHEKLLFGTDYLAPEQDVPQLRFRDIFDLTDEIARDVYHRNLDQLLR
jgi:predicted TIM-barrel fold metal-dependent hydrolase